MKLKKMEFFETEKSLNDINSDKLVAIFSKNLQTAVKMAVFLINNRFTVIPLNPSISGEKIGRYLASVNCKKIVSDEDLPPDFNYDCRLSDIKEMDLFRKSSKKDLKIGNIFQDIRYEYERKTNIIFTSGSAGMPKAVLHTLGNHYYSSLGSNINIEFNEKDKWLIVLPLYHISGLSIIFRAALSGGKIAVREPGMEVGEAIKINKPSHISLVPHQLQGLLNCGKNIDILRRMKAILVGGAGMPFALAEQSFKYRLNLFVSYGSTEMCSQVTCTRNKDSLEHLKTSGRLLEYREIKINEKNSILVKGKTLFAGYIVKDKNDNRLLLKKKLDADGYFDTGDNGCMDNDGYLHIRGRRDISFKYKAEKIYPEEIERVFLDISGVEEAVVVPYKKNDFEKIPVVFLKVDNFCQNNPAYIMENAKKELEPFKFPCYFLKWPYISDALKPSRKEMHNIAREIIDKKIKERFFC